MYRVYNRRFFIQMQIDSKIGSGSQATSEDMIKYLFNIQNLLGEGNFPEKYGEELGKSYAGIITMLLDVTIYSFMGLSSLKAYFSSNREKHLLGLGCLYYVLHGVKANYLMVSYPYFVLIFFITYLLNKKVELS